MFHCLLKEDHWSGSQLRSILGGSNLTFGCCCGVAAGVTCVTAWTLLLWICRAVFRLAANSIGRSCDSRPPTACDRAGYFWHVSGGEAAQVIDKYVYLPSFIIQRMTCASWNKTENKLYLTENTLYLSKGPYVLHSTGCWPILHSCSFQWDQPLPHHTKHNALGMAPDNT